MAEAKPVARPEGARPPHAKYHEHQPPDDLPHPLTFFLTAAERRAVLQAHRPFGPRAAALLRALRIAKGGRP